MKQTCKRCKKITDILDLFIAVLSLLILMGIGYYIGCCVTEKNYSGYYYYKSYAEEPKFDEFVIKPNTLYLCDRTDSNTRSCEEYFGSLKRGKEK